MSHEGDAQGKGNQSAISQRAELQSTQIQTEAAVRPGEVGVGGEVVFRGG